MDKNAIKTELEKLGEDSVKITVTVEADEVDRRVKGAYRTISQEYRFKGFRPGHVPRDVIDKQFGAESARARATDGLLNDSYPIALDSCDVIPLADPEFNADKLVEEGASYTFDMTAKVKPSFELSSYDPVEVELPSEEATDEDVEAQLEVLKSYQYTFEEVTDRKVEAHDYLVLSIDAQSDGEKVERLCNDERIYQLGNGLLPEKFDEQLIGKKPGESVKFTLTPEDGIDGDKPVDFDVTVLKIREKVYAEIDDEFAKKCGAEDLADLKAKLVEGIAEQKKDQLPRLKEDRALTALAERLDGEASEEFINITHGELAQQLFSNLQRSGMTLDMYLAQNGLSSEQFQDDLKQQAKDLAQQSLALDALARHLEMTISDEDIENEFHSAVENPDEAAKLLEEWRQGGRLPSLREALVRSKATEWTVENAVVTTEAAKKETPKKAAAKKSSTSAAGEKKAPAKKPAAKKTDTDMAAKPAEKKAATAKKPAAKKTAAKDKASE